MALGLIPVNLPPWCLMHQKPQSNCFSFTWALLVATFFKFFFFFRFFPSVPPAFLCVRQKRYQPRLVSFKNIVLSLLSIIYIFLSPIYFKHARFLCLLCLQLTFSTYWFHGTNSEKYFLSDFREVLWKKFIPIFIWISIQWSLSFIKWAKAKDTQIKSGSCWHNVYHSIEYNFLWQVMMWIFLQWKRHIFSADTCS